MKSLPLFPLNNALFPDGVLHLRVFEIRYLDMIKKCLADGTEFGVVVLLEGGEVRTPGSTETLASVGTLARIDTWAAPMPALLELRCVGTTRFRLESAAQGQYGLWLGDAAPIAPDPVLPIPAGLQPAADALGKLIARMQQEGFPAERMPIAPPYRLDECGWVANRWCELLPLPPADKERLLEMEDVQQRLTEVQGYLSQRKLLP